MTLIHFILGLIFGATIPLTPDPVTITGQQDFVVQTMSSVDGSGRVQVLLSKQVPITLGISESFDVAKSKFPPGSIRAVLYQSKGRSSVTLRYSGGISYSNKGTALLLEPEGPEGDIDTSAHFDRVKIISDEPLQDVKLYWRNWGGK